MPQTFGITRTTLPSASSEGVSQQLRTSRYGDLSTLQLSNTFSAQAMEGTRFAASNPTFGTAIAGGIQTTFSDTANVLCSIRNTDASGGKNIILDYLRVFYTVAPASATSSEFALSLDTTNRYSSGGTQLTPVNVNSGSATASLASIFFGAVTATAASGTTRRMYRDKIKHAIPVVGDEINVNFAAENPMIGAAAGATPQVFGSTVGPVIVAPGHTALVHLWHPANATTGPSYEVDLAWAER